MFLYISIVIFSGIFLCIRSEEQMKTVLLAIGNKEYSSILRQHLSSHSDDFKILEQEVMHFQYLDEILEIESPNILLLHDYYLPTDIEEKDKDKHWLEYIQHLRIKYDDKIRVVYLCERDKGDAYFRYLIGSNVLDIFNTNAIDLARMIEQLKNPPKFSNVAHLLQNKGPISHVLSEDEDTEQQNVSEVEDEQKDDELRSSFNEDPKEKERPIIQKVVEKKVKVVNKQVIKRDFHIQILNKTERVIGVPIERKLVVVSSPFPRSGCTLISHLIAKHIFDLGVNVTYIENPFSIPYTYDRFAREDISTPYRSIFHPSSDGVSNSERWEHEGVELIAKHPSERYTEKDITFDNIIRILMSITSPITIFDIGCDWKHPVYKDIYDIATNIFFIMEPDVSNIQYLEDSNIPCIEYFWELVKQEKTSIIFNKSDSFFDGYQELQDLYSDKLLTKFPQLPVSEIFKSQYKGEFLNNNRNLQKEFGTPLQEIVETLLPKEFLTKKFNQPFLKRLFKKRIQLSTTLNEEKQ